MVAGTPGCTDTRSSTISRSVPERDARIQEALPAVALIAVFLNESQGISGWPFKSLWPPCRDEPFRNESSSTKFRASGALPRKSPKTVSGNTVFRAFAAHSLTGLFSTRVGAGVGGAVGLDGLEEDGLEDDGEYVDGSDDDGRELLGLEVGALVGLTVGSGVG